MFRDDEHSLKQMISSFNSPNTFQAHKWAANATWSSYSKLGNQDLPRVESEVFQGLQAPSFLETSRPIRVSVTPQGGLVRRRSVWRTGLRIGMLDLPGSLGLHPAKEMLEIKNRIKRAK